jgi:hypothetical protein
MLENAAGNAMTSFFYAARRRSRVAAALRASSLNPSLLTIAPEETDFAIEKNVFHAGIPPAPTSAAATCFVFRR